MGSKSKQAAARLGDIDTGHPPSPPTPVITGSTNVLTNGRPAARKGDKLVPHHPGIRTITEGSASVLINGKNAARVSDGINCGGKIIVGSGNVLIGDKPEAPRNAKLQMEFDELMDESFKPEFQKLSPHQQAEVAANIAVKYRKQEGGISTWHEHYLSNDPAPGELSDPLKQKGHQRAQNEKAKDAKEMLGDVSGTGSDASLVTSFDQAEERLAQARNEIIKRKAAGGPPYKPKYTDEQLLGMVESGSVANERFLVSIQPKNIEEGASLAHRKDSGLVPVWTTSLDQLEAADSDPELLHQVIGAESNYDPDKEYVMHIIDRGENLENFGNNTIVPDWDNLADASVRELGGSYNEETIRAAMNSEYQSEYAAKMDEFWEAGGNQFNKKHLQSFSETMPLEEADKFKTRHSVRTEIGANTEFTGNGLTANTANGGGQYGVVETLSLEKNLPPLSDLQDSGILKTIDLIPI